MKRTVILASLLLTMALFFYMIVISVPNNALSLNNSVFNNSKMNALLPEGWAFFTRSPREEQVYIYTYKDLNKVSLKNTDISQFLGIKRKNRFIQDKLGKIVSGIESKYWFKYNTSKDIEHILDSLNYITVSVEKPSLCGEYIIEVRRTMPWAYYKSELSKNIAQDRKLVRVGFECKNN
ncbi:MULTISPECIES: SdpA family antimicrobial peptide system protein [Weeksella]|uniref:SdpA family antimicrobial peptide system protein n=1 Tax=Weeksella TaxID=1013 RepID=UPI0009F4CE7D|nr:MULTISPECIES: SdpA family antimicrobial peptide system protein [Weeksella]MDK7375602.1 SdpA family antimicrobial peptide system protein [Weeksella virosa]